MVSFSSVRYVLAEDSSMENIDYSVGDNFVEAFPQEVTNEACYFGRTVHFDLCARCACNDESISYRLKHAVDITECQQRTELLGCRALKPTG
jgi:hypothetical protein